MAQYSTNGGNVGSMKSAAKADFVPGLARRAKAAGPGKVVVELRPNGIGEKDFEYELRRNQVGWLKKEGKYALTHLG